MGVELKFTDRELPVSPVFILFLAQLLTGEPCSGEIWADQLSEALAPPDADLARRAAAAAQVVMSSADGRDLLARAYGLLYSLLCGDLAPLQQLQSRFHFVGVIGIPRTGGSYLTAELYRALGMLPEHVPDAVAHDSFPQFGPFDLQPGVNSWLLSLKTLAEYLTMVEVFFSERPRHGGRIVVPKKLTNSVYCGGLLPGVLKEALELVVTVRHPAAACASTYEKSGGLPPDGRFAVRSNIEQWCRRDLLGTGCDPLALSDLDYFGVYLKYWEQYHLSLAVSGLSACPRLRVVAYGRGAFQDLAQSYHDRFGSALPPAPFQVSDRARRLHPQWLARAAPVVERTAAAWRALGLPFPLDEVTACW